MLYRLFWVMLVGAYFAPLAFMGKLEIWTAQALWIKACAFFIFCVSLTKCSRFEQSKHGWKPIFWVLIFSGVSTFIHFGHGLFLFDKQVEPILDTFVSAKYQIIEAGVDRVNVVMTRGKIVALEAIIRSARHLNALINIVIFAMLYKIACGYLTKRHFKKLLLTLRWLLIIQLLIATLQYFNLDQFWVNKYVFPNPESRWNNNPVIGFIGNATHFSGYIAMTAPLLLLKPGRETNLALILCAVILTFFTGTTLGDPSIMGIAIFPVTTMYCLFYFNREKFWQSFALCVFSMSVVMFFLPEDIFNQLFASNGRLNLWGYYWQKVSAYPIFGMGLESIRHFSILAPSEGLQNAKHLHFEYYHILLELGLLGLVVILGGIKNFLSSECQTREQIICKSVVLGYFLTGFFNYPFHLWSTSICFIIVYSAFWRLAR